MIEYFIVKHKKRYGIRFNISDEIFAPDGIYFVGPMGISYEVYPNYRFSSLDQAQKTLQVFKNDMVLKRKLSYEIIEYGTC